MGECLQLGEVKIGDGLIDSAACKVTDTELTITDVPDAFTLTIETFLKPQENFRWKGCISPAVTTAHSVRPKVSE